MSNITKNNKIGIFAIFIASALMLGTISVSGLDSAFAKSSSNEAEQEIEQQQFSSQDSQCISGEDTTNSCDNLAVQLNLNTGNQALGQE